MEYVRKLMDRREVLMDKYIIFLQKASLTEEELKDKRRINKEIIHLDFEIEKAKKEVQMI
ncbi:MAG: hypothetical protein N4A64_14150 [Marinisporobacter sp.]|jgi:hypothetical protein|nr:hypothetical protein [Marinisporobacter sp.]